MVQFSASFDGLPDELLTGVAIDASRDADMVGMFLNSLGICGTDEKPIFLPREFLLYLAAAMRLLSWEDHGFTFHREVGLPGAREAILDSFRILADPKATATELTAKVLRLFIERFAWTGWRDLGGDMALDDMPEDAAFDALAEYLWVNRNSESRNGSDFS